MKYFIDFEFLEGDVPVKMFGQNIPKWLIKPNNTIQPISVGICSSDGREYYSISKDFNLKEAWNRFDLIRDGFRDFGMTPNFKKDYWIRDNVLKPIWIELKMRDLTEYNTALKRNVVIDYPEYSFTYKALKMLIKKYGKSNKEIAKEVKHFCLPSRCFVRDWYETKHGNLDTSWDFSNLNNYETSFNEEYDNYQKPEFYGYYSDYDWVVFCWLFGKMIDLPKEFPMFAFDLKQELDKKVNSLNWLYCRDIWSNSNRSIKTIGKGQQQEKDRDATFEEKIKIIKELAEYPKQTNEHNALSDARFNYELYKFLKDI